MVVPVTAAFEVELERETGAKPVYLVNMVFSTGNRRFAMWPYDVNYTGNTFFGLGPVERLGTVEWAADTPLTEALLSFYVQNDPDLLEDLQQNSRRRICNIRLVFVDDDNQAIGNDSIFIAHRRMVPGPIVGSRNGMVSSIALESRLHTHLNRAPETYSHASAQKRDPTDFAFQDVGKNFDTTRARYTQKSGLG